MTTLWMLSAVKNVWGAPFHHIPSRGAAFHGAATPNPQRVPVCTENLNPDVVVMKSAKDRV